jgi:hypothetical protein
MDRRREVEWKKGSAELLILSLVEARPRHGYEISKLIEQRSGGTVRFHVAHSTRCSTVWNAAAGCVKRMLPQSENAVLVVMSVLRLLLWRVEMT